MLADWLSFGFKLKQDEHKDEDDIISTEGDNVEFENWYNLNKSKIIIHPDMKDWLDNIIKDVITDIKENNKKIYGESYTFNSIERKHEDSDSYIIRTDKGFIHFMPNNSYKIVTDINDASVGYNEDDMKMMLITLLRKFKQLKAAKLTTIADAKKDLVDGKIKFIFVVDLYNEGVDIPEVNTILFLRPTESATVFLQQLGRGLRLHKDKECLTVLDFIGQAHKKYNYSTKFRAMIGPSRKSVSGVIEDGFDTLPRGCFIQLEKLAKEYILSNLKQTNVDKRSLIEQVKYFEADTSLPLTLDYFLDYHGISLLEFYRPDGTRSLFRLKKWAELIEDKRDVDNNVYKKFAAMESALSKLQSQTSQLSGLLGM